MMTPPCSQLSNSVGMDRQALTRQACRTRDLLDAGWRREEITSALVAGRLVRLRRGWYATPTSDERVVRAVRAGGALACVSALAYWGAWDVTGGIVHVRTDHNRSTRMPDGLRHCHSVGDRDDRAPTTAVDSVDIALRAAWRCLSSEDFVVVCDSLVNTGLMTLDQVRAAIGPMPGRDAVMARCDTAESGTESIVRLRLRSLGIGVRTQVWIDGVGRVDLLVGDRLVIEVDSVAHHTGLDHYRSDRRRDLALRELGYVVVRLTYEQVLFDWPRTEAALLTMVRRADHWSQPWRHGHARRATSLPRAHAVADPIGGPATFNHS